jgi:hypothetical protein
MLHQLLVRPLQPRHIDLLDRHCLVRRRVLAAEHIRKRPTAHVSAVGVSSLLKPAFFLTVLSALFASIDTRPPKKQVAAFVTFNKKERQSLRGSRSLPLFVLQN